MDLTFETMYNDELIYISKTLTYKKTNKNSMAAINFYQRCNQLQNSHIAYKLPSDIQETVGIRDGVYSGGRRASSSLGILNGRI